ncbi:ROK family protein [Streptomyces sp. HNM0663]|uniref:ROK family protein n=1 Tax=Streptomyces chengmaiensis TaxID=3040919 RepID=A0ABT6HZB7_9ACTN|nr:ROK family protein [Streptomyces chengmaiensis]MDH2394032.1 ROK family protein [Streptomyces chengmaiensis]
MPPTSPAKPTVCIDANRVAVVRRSNLGGILKLLRDHGPRSRSQLATEMGLPKATISTLVAELLERSLVREGELTRNQGLGRPGLTLVLDGSGVCGLGIEISTTCVRGLALDPLGSVVFESQRPLDTTRLGIEEVFDITGDLARQALAEISSRGIQPLRLCLVTPGTVDPDRGDVVFAANVAWHDTPALAMLRQRIGRQSVDLRIENDAHAASLAELTASAAGMGNLLLLTGESGVAAGVLIDGKLTRLNGEVGHAPLGPADTVCACGRRGCWETAVGGNALLSRIADAGDTVRDHTVSLEERLAEVRRRAIAGDARTLDGVRYVSDHLCHGLSVLTDIVGPQVIVLGGYFSFLSDYFVPAAQTALNARVMTPVMASTRVVGSSLGFAAATRGAAEIALGALFDDPTLVRPPSDA